MSDGDGGGFPVSRLPSCLPLNGQRHSGGACDASPIKPQTPMTMPYGAFPNSRNFINILPAIQYLLTFWKRKLATIEVVGNKVDFDSLRRTLFTSHYTANSTHSPQVKFDYTDKLTVTTVTTSSHNKMAFHLYQMQIIVILRSKM